MVPHVAQLLGVAGVAAPPAKQLHTAAAALLAALGQQHVTRVAVHRRHHEHTAAAVGHAKACGVCVEGCV